MTEAEVTAMPTAEFRAWLRTLDAPERDRWRKFRRRLSQARAERKRTWDKLTEEQREAKRATFRRWRERNVEKHRQDARDQWKRIQADPERHAAYLQKKREDMRRRRREAKEAA